MSRDETTGQRRAAMQWCRKCGRPEGEHSREALSSPNPQGWKWNQNACPVGEGPFHPEQVFEGEPKCGHRITRFVGYCILPPDHNGPCDPSEPRTSDDLCPLCNSPLQRCSEGCYCSSKTCNYAM